MKRKLFALAGGLVGTTVLTALHQTIRYTLPDIAPRMDLFDLSLIHKVGDQMHLSLPSDDELYKMTFISEIVCNTAYYTLIGGDCPTIKSLVFRYSCRRQCRCFTGTFRHRPCTEQPYQSNTILNSRLLRCRCFGRCCNYQMA